MSGPDRILNPELEDFRRQWHEEVSSRSKRGGRAQTEAIPSPVPVKQNLLTRSPAFSPKPQEEIEYINEEQFRDPKKLDRVTKAGLEDEDFRTENIAGREPQSALEHYEKAQEQESQGRLGDSVNLYRKAFRLDAGVETAYRKKHHPPLNPRSKPTNPNLSNSPVTVPNPAHHSFWGAPAPPQTVSQLITSFAGENITGASPLTDLLLPTPCPIASLPSELLIKILHDLAILDVGSFSRLSLVCKKLAFLVATEDRIWRRISHGSEFGFAAMHYKWACPVLGSLLPMSIEQYDKALSRNHDPPEQDTRTTDDDLPDVSVLSLSVTPLTVQLPVPNAALPTWRQIFRSYPRIRFNGCYISTVNYQRPGATSSSQISWNTPIHIVTYYRYLRFYRDGTCISLLSTHEPIEVVRHLSKENLPNIMQEPPKRHHHHHQQNYNQLQSDANTTLPSTAKAIMANALAGRWHLSPDPSSQHTDVPPTTVHIETLSHDPHKYIFVMALGLTSANTSAKSSKAGGTRNTKMAWKGFWSYNKLTDDWAEFGLKNDKAFWWSRVGGYGLGTEAGI